MPDTAVFERDLFGLIEAGVVEIAVDLSEVGSLDASLLVALSAADMAVDNASGHLYVLVTRPYLLHQIHAVGFRRVTPLFMSKFPARAADIRRTAVERGIGRKERPDERHDEAGAGDRILGAVRGHDDTRARRRA